MSANQHNPLSGHDHIFLGGDHQRSERKTWAVIVLCGTMMAIEIVGGLVFGSIALVADGLHMSTHASALLLTALAYAFARKHRSDDRFTFGTGKLGDLAGFTSAIILAMIAVLIGYESITRAFQPVPIHFLEAIPIACLGLAVNIASAWLLSRGGQHHDHTGHDHESHTPIDAHRIAIDGGSLILEVYEEGVPPRFRLSAVDPAQLNSKITTIETIRADGARHVFAMHKPEKTFLESLDEIPEPHDFVAHVRIGARGDYPVVFKEHVHSRGGVHRDNNMRSALIHVAADAAVSAFVIFGLLLARAFGWLWMDPLAGLLGACVIASWSYGLIRDTGAILLDMNPDRQLADSIRNTIEREGDRLVDLHLWRVGPAHLAAILSVTTEKSRDAIYYRRQLARYKILSHVTVEVLPLATT